MKAEMDTIQIRVEHLIQNFFPSLLGVIASKRNEVFDACIQEVTGYKERFEDLLCETDIKEQDHL